VANDLNAPLRSEPVFDEFGNFNTRYAEFFDQLGVDTNSITDRLDLIEARLDLIEARLGVIELAIVAIVVRLVALEALILVPVTTAVNLTTTGNQIVKCTNTAAITITLNSSPNDSEELIIARRQTGAVTISGAINGATSKKIAFRYNSVHLRYFADLSEWGVV